MWLCAQAASSAADVQAPAAEDSKYAPAVERAAREGDRVFKWILMNSGLPKRPGAVAEKAPPAERKARSVGVAASVPSRPASVPSGAVAPARPAASSPAAQGAAEPSAEAAAPSEPLQAVEATAAAAEEDQPLVLVHQVEPDYPVTIVRRQQKGFVLLRFVVQPDGSVAQPEVLKSSNARLNAAALQALAQWRFQPLHHAQTGSAELDFDVTQATEP
jgi:TonB family protein